jgi:hypothetical protein
MSKNNKHLSISCIILIIIFSWTSQIFLKQIDKSRLLNSHDIEDRYYLPHPVVTRTVSTGYHTMIADILWIRTILIFSDFASSCKESQAQWLLSMIRTISHLDPKWRTLYFYGGTMMGVCNEHEISDELFLMGHENLPDDYFFPFSLALNAYIYRKDYKEAERWMRIAANKEGAPNWYKATVSEMINQQGQRDTSIKYLEEELKGNLSSAVRSSSEERLRILLHEKYAEEIEQKRIKFERKSNMPLKSIEQITIEHADPWDKGWLLAPDGKIRSIEMERREIIKTRNKEREMLRKY